MNSLSTGGIFIMMIPKLNPVTSAKTISIFITLYLPPLDSSSPPRLWTRSRHAASPCDASGYAVPSRISLVGLFLGN